MGVKILLIFSNTHFRIIRQIDVYLTVKSLLDIEHEPS